MLAPSLLSGEDGDLGGVNIAPVHMANENDPAAPGAAPSGELGIGVRPVHHQAGDAAHTLVPPLLNNDQQNEQVVVLER